MSSSTLRQIEYALAIGRHGGLSAAASALHVSQPALSVALADLEAHLGQPLFLRRKGTPMRPTGFGADWLADAARQVDGITALFAAQGRPARRLAVFEDLAPMVLAPLLAGAERLGLHPVTSSAGFAALASALMQGEVDLALTWNIGLPPGLAREELTRIAPQAILAPDHPLAAKGEDPGRPCAPAADPVRSGPVRRALAGAVLSRRADPEHRPPLCQHRDDAGLRRARPWRRPWLCPARPRVSHDGTPFVLRKIVDAGTEALVLARLKTAPEPPALPELRRFLTSLFVTKSQGFPKPL